MIVNEQRYASPCFTVVCGNGKGLRGDILAGALMRAGCRGKDGGVDSVELVAAALAAGAAAGFKDTATSAVKDTYAALIRAVRRCVGRGDIAKPAAVEGLATAPEARREELVTALRAAGVGEDAELVAAAREMLRLMDLDGARAKNYADARGAEHVQVGDHNTINNYEAGVAPPGGAARGMAAFRVGAYDVAVSELNAALHVQPADADLHYYLALALLRGRRPHQIRSQAELSAVRHHLNLAGTLVHAQVLKVLVEEDCGRYWERGGSISTWLLELAQSVALDHVAEMAEHVPAPQNRVWELLTQTLERRR
jgi:hypothetical protein